MKFCFFGHIIDALEGKSTGGAELQIALLAKALALNGHKVVVIDPGAIEQKIIQDGIRIYNVKGWRRGIRGLRLITHKLPNLVNLLQGQSADVYYVRGFSFWSIVVMVISKFRKATFLLATAHDSDLLSLRVRYNLFYIHNNTIWEWVSNYGLSELFAPMTLKFADVVIVQHEGQRELAKQKGRDAVVFKNIVVGQSAEVVPYTQRKNFLFVGELNVRKGLPEMLRIVSECTQATFDIIGPPTDDMGRKTYTSLQKLSNVTLWGRVVHEETLKTVARARALLNTSPREGFPNTFLEAWNVGTPVLSLTVDPANIIENNNLGYVCKGNIDEMKRKLDEFGDTFSLEAMKNYVQENHSFDTAAERFCNIILAYKTQNSSLS